MGLRCQDRIEPEAQEGCLPHAKGSTARIQGIEHDRPMTKADQAHTVWPMGAHEKHLKLLRIELERRLIPAAEKRYGPRDQTWKIGDFIFDDRGPEVVPLQVGDTKAVMFFLSPSAGLPVNYDQALYQMAHEVVHLLQPANGPGAPMFEEGLAVEFSLHRPLFRDRDYRRRAIEGMHGNYLEAWNVAKRGLAVIGADEGVRQLRVLRPLLRSWDVEFLMANTRVTQDLAQAMCETRKMRP